MNPPSIVFFWGGGGAWLVLLAHSLNVFSYYCLLYLRMLLIRDQMAVVIDSYIASYVYSCNIILATEGIRECGFVNNALSLCEHTR